MHYSPKCFISPFPTFLELGTAPASRHVKGEERRLFIPSIIVLRPARCEKRCPPRYLHPLRRKRTTFLELFRGYSRGLETRKFEVYAEAKLPSLGRSCPEEQQGSPLLSSFLFPFLSRTELPFHRVSIFPIQPRSPANVNSVGKVGRARAIACRASLSPTGFSYSARRSARPEFFQAPQRGRCPVFVPPPL